MKHTWVRTIKKINVRPSAIFDGRLSSAAHKRPPFNPGFALILLLMLNGCKEDSDFCASDADCESGNICDFISGTCFPADIEFSNGFFSGDYSCIIAPDALSGGDLGSTTVYGGWNDELLSLEAFTNCYIDAETGSLRLEISGRRAEGNDVYTYILTLITPPESLQGNTQLSIVKSVNPQIGEAYAQLGKALWQNGQSVNGIELGIPGNGTWTVSGNTGVGDTISGSVALSLSALGTESEFTSQCVPELFQGGYDLCQAQTHSTYGDVISYSWSDGATGNSSTINFQFYLWQDFGAPTSPGSYQFTVDDESPQACAACLTVEDLVTGDIYTPVAGGTYVLDSVYPVADAVGEQFTATIDAELQAIDSNTGAPLSSGCSGNLYVQIDVPIEAP
ncbi:MAG: hypothetical protein JXX29_14505 [Deltaproteobacteria bacterium]|nr:hypothetical protein [Deltaproteobacteria bacterium]MBN2672891.1 hypothetical protein [Deltaproteobacteria bacterium]